MPVRTVAILGAGVSGLASIKSCLDEGLEPTCFERFDEIGGTWRFTEKSLPGQGPTVFDHLAMNTSKRMTAFSDFPFPDSTAEFPDYQTSWNYLRDYCEHFDLRKHIRFNTEVKSLKQSPTYDKDGSWVVTVYDKSTNQEASEQFDAVLVCTGFYRDPYIPDIPGLDKFKGEIKHTHSHRRAEIFRGKKVLVIGRSDSAADMAGGASTCAKEVTLSVGPGCWMFGRFENNGTPYDLSLLTMASIFRSDDYTISLFEKHCHAIIDPGKYKIRSPSCKRPIEREPIMPAPDSTIQAVKAGKVSVKLSYVSSFAGRRVTFEDGSSIDDVDLVMFATGYKPEWSLLPPEARQDPMENFNHYRNMIPINYRHPTLAVLGSFQVYAAVWAIEELQCRWIAAVFSGHVTLPSHKDMRTEVDGWLMKYKSLTLSTKYRFMNALAYAYELCKDMQILPPFWKSLFTHPIELYRWYVGPAFSVIFRMYGRQAWSGARSAWEDCYNKPYVK